MRTPISAVGGIAIHLDEGILGLSKESVLTMQSFLVFLDEVFQGLGGGFVCFPQFSVEYSVSPSYLYKLKKNNNNH